MKRVFLAVSFKENKFLSQYITAIKSKLKAENIKWAEEKNMHLTLKFFGPRDNLMIEKIKSNIEHVCKNQKSFEISFNHLGVFGSKYQPRVLWMGMKDGSEVVAFSNLINQELEKIDIYANRQNFVPHLTIGRIKKLDSKKYFQSVVDKFKEYDSGTIRINQILLYQSIIHKEGPEYKVLAEYKLK